MPWHISPVLNATLRRKFISKWEVVTKFWTCVMWSDQLLASETHNNFDLRPKITKKEREYYNPLDFYPPAREKLSLPYTSPDLVQNLKWSVMGASYSNRGCSKLEPFSLKGDQGTWSVFESEHLQPVIHLLTYIVQLLLDWWIIILL